MAQCFIADKASANSKKCCLFQFMNIAESLFQVNAAAGRRELEADIQYR